MRILSKWNGGRQQHLSTKWCSRWHCHVSPWWWGQRWRCLLPLQHGQRQSWVSLWGRSKQRRNNTKYLCHLVKQLTNMKLWYCVFLSVTNLSSSKKRITIVAIYVLGNDTVYILGRLWGLFILAIVASILPFLLLSDFKPLTMSVVWWNWPQ